MLPSLSSSLLAPPGKIAMYFNKSKTRDKMLGNLSSAVQKCVSDITDYFAEKSEDKELIGQFFNCNANQGLNQVSYKKS